MEVLMPDFERGKALDPSTILGFELEFLPLSLQKVVLKTLYLGYRSLFYAVGTLLDKESELPTVENILANLRFIPEDDLDGRSIRFYTNKGGRVEYVLDCVAFAAKEQSADLGDGTFDETMDDLAENQGDEEDRRWRDLPHCANDKEYGLVRAMMGLDPGEICGPYYSLRELQGLRFGM
jgi:hypothetical protein